MANEITLSISAQLKNPTAGTGIADKFEPGNRLVSQATAAAFQATVTATVAAANLTLTGIATNGLLFLQNLDATNAIDFGLNAGGFQALVTLKPGEVAAFRLKAGVTLQHQAAAGTPKFIARAWND